MNNNDKVASEITDTSSRLAKEKEERSFKIKGKVWSLMHALVKTLKWKSGVAFFLIDFTRLHLEMKRSDFFSYRLKLF